MDTQSETLFGMDEAAAMACQAIDANIMREEDAVPFMGWLMDTYCGEVVDYVYSISLRTLRERWLDSIN